MTRLPVPGKDQNVWGSVLNDFLNVAHNSDGTLKISKDQIGLAKVDNTSDLDKPISTATEIALAAKISLGGDIFGTSAAPRIKRTSRFIVAPFGDGRPADFTCQGQNNNQVEINAAIAAANDLPGGGVVELLDGVFTVNSSVIHLSNVWLRGQNMFNTKIQVVQNAAFAVFNNTGVYNIDNPWQNAIMSDFEIDASNHTRVNAYKGVHAQHLENVKFLRLYIHGSSATGLGPDYHSGVTISECIIKDCGYQNPHNITAASWASNAFTFGTADAHGYEVGDYVLVTGMTPATYNGFYVVSTVPSSNTFTIGTDKNSSAPNITHNPGTATGFGKTSDTKLTQYGHNGIGLGSGKRDFEGVVVTNNICIGNQDNNYLIEENGLNTTENASYIFSGNISINGGTAGFRNTSAPNAHFVNNHDYGSLTGIYVDGNKEVHGISAASWSGGVVSFAVPSATNFAVGDYVTVNGMNPSAYNIYGKITAMSDNMHFQLAMANNPGTVVGFGVATKIKLPVDGTIISGNTLSCNNWYGIRQLMHSDGLNINHNTVKNGLNHAVVIAAGNTSCNNNRIYSNGQNGVYVFGGLIQPIDNLDIANNLIYNNGRAVAQKDGIVIESSVSSPCSNISIKDNHCFDNQTTKTQRFGILIRSGGDNTNIQVTGNNCAGNATAAIYVQDTSNSIYCKDNIGLNPEGKSVLGEVATGTVTFNPTQGNYFTATLTGNITASFPTSTYTLPGTEITLVLKQDSTGGRIMYLPANAVAANNDYIPLSSLPGAVDTVKFIWDGSKWREVSRAMAKLAPRITNVTTFATLTPNADTTDQYNVTALTSSSTFAAPSGAPSDGQNLTIRIKDNGVSHYLTWDAVYKSSGSATPLSATQPGKTHLVRFVYDAVAAAWICYFSDTAGY